MSNSEKKMEELDRMTEEDSSDDYFTAEEDPDLELSWEFVLWTSQDGTVWHLPSYFRAETSLE